MEGPDLQHALTAQLPWTPQRLLIMQLMLSVVLPPNAVTPLLSSTVYWLLLCLLVGGLANRLPAAWFRCPPLRPIPSSAPEIPIPGIRVPEVGNPEVRIPGIRRWKRWIPDAGAVLPGGVTKASLVQRDPQSLRRLLLETRRAAWVHGLLWAGWLPTALWLPPLGVLVNLVFASLFNIPCLLLQRHTRARVQRCLLRAHALSHARRRSGLRERGLRDR